MLDIEKIVKKEYNEWKEICFGNWIHCLFLRGDDNLSFCEQKEIFFQTLKKLLDDDKVVFFHPFPEAKVKLYTYYVDGEKYQEELWDETSENIVTYIKEIFPKGITDENDDILTEFWYAECPEIGWIDQKTGEIVAS